MSINTKIDNILTYQSISNTIHSFEPIIIETHTPQVTQAEINAGELLRFFCRPVNQKSPIEIQEIDNTTYTQLKINNFYTIVEVKWKIKGSLTDQFGLTNLGTSVRLYTGVITANKLSISVADEILSGLQSIILDYKKFWQGE